MGRKAVPQPLTLADSMRPGEDPRVGETVPNSAPPNTSSPRSPRSPFRFGQKKTEGAAAGPQALHVTDVLQHQWQPTQQSQQQQHQIAQPAKPSEDSYPPELASPAQSPFHKRDQSPAQQQRGRNHQRQDEDKSSKSGFFFFSKSAKSSDRLNTYPTTDVRGETMSRDSDHPNLSKQSTQQSGMHNTTTNPIRLATQSERTSFVCQHWICC